MILSKSPKHLFRHVLLAGSALLLMACATATPYQAASEPGGFDGFSQQLIEDDRARVTFGGNSLTKRDTVENYLLYRAAEMAVERGYDNFTLQERDLESNKRVRVSPGLGYDPYFGYSFFRPNFGWSRSFAFSRFSGFNRFNGFGRRGFGRSSFGRRGFGNSGFFGSSFNDPFFNDANVREITKYRATAEVKFGRGPAPDTANSFDAREVIENLSDTIELPDPG